MSPASTVVRLLASVHCYLGIAMALVFAIWFATGAVMLFVPYPALSDAQRLVGLVAIDTTASRITPVEATVAESSTNPVQRIRLTDTGDGPAYRLSVLHGADVAVDAKTGARREITSGSAKAIAQQHYAAMSTSLPAASTVALQDYDQWTVHQRFDALRPLFRVEFEDAERTEIYVSSRSGEVVQQTTRHQRVWNYAGAVLHWVYFTPLRKSHNAWDQTVWWLSLVGIVVAVSGGTLGVIRIRAPMRVRPHTRSGRMSRLTSVSPFRGLMAWHHLLGVCAALFVVSWIFSGWLSMDHGRLFSKPAPEQKLLDAWRGGSLRDALSRHEGSIDLPNTAREIEWISVGGRSMVITRDQADSHLIRSSKPSGKMLPLETIGLSLQSALNAIGSSAQVVTVTAIELNDVYGHLKNESLPASAVRASLTDGTWIHIDALNGTLLEVMPPDRRAYRWLFNGLHSWDVPPLTSRPALWWGWIITLLALGFTLSVTAVILGWRFVTKSTRSF